MRSYSMSGNWVAGITQRKNSSKTRSVRTVMIRRRSQSPRDAGGSVERTTLFLLQVIQALSQPIRLILELVQAVAQGL